MIQELQLLMLPAEAKDNAKIAFQLRSKLALSKGHHLEFEILRRSIDARGRQVKIQLSIRAYVDEAPLAQNAFSLHAQDVSKGREVHIIGAGPAGFFCALQCIELGLKPVIFERGKNVRDRRRDLAILNKEGVLNEESNYCFGEGGAGTYSDGKLYTRSHKRGNVQKVLELFHFFGASEDILIDAHPHIGTNKLPHIIEAIREAIIECGGEIHFNARMTGIEHADSRIRSIEINEQYKVEIDNLVLATGHSARDIYELLHRNQILIESKPFAMGVRIEHPQALIDEIQYHCPSRDPLLPPASYSLVEQVNGRGIFSFCMCPGGIIAPASTAAETLVLNGWSPSKRNNPFANSGMVVSVDEKDFGNSSPLDGLHYQFAVEQKAFTAGGGKYVAPAQRMDDFVKGNYSTNLPVCSYLPGLNSSQLSDVLPAVVHDSLRKALKQFGKKMKGYYTNEAVVVATESRTSSPVRIPRNKATLQHLHIENLYPCAEGAGYAGGIVSAAMDGMRVAEKLG